MRSSGGDGPYTPPSPNESFTRGAAHLATSSAPTTLEEHPASEAQVSVEPGHGAVATSNHVHSATLSQESHDRETMSTASSSPDRDAG